MGDRRERAARMRARCCLLKGVRGDGSLFCQGPLVESYPRADLTVWFGHHACRKDDANLDPNNMQHNCPKPVERAQIVTLVHTTLPVVGWLLHLQVGA